jgi:hypothetical protein
LPDGKNHPNSKKENVPSDKLIMKVLNYLGGPPLLDLYRRMYTGNAGSESCFCNATVRRAVSRTERGKGSYDRFYITIPIAFARAMHITEGTVVQIRRPWHYK